MFKGFDNVSLSVSNLASAKAFYGEVLGLPFKEEYGPNMCFFSVPGSETSIMLQQRENPVAGTGYITLAVDDVRARKAELEARGAQNIDGPFPIPAVGYGIDFKDPDGNVICLIDYSDMK